MFEKINFSSENENFSENNLEENSEKNLESNKNNDENELSDKTDNTADLENNLDDSQKDNKNLNILAEEEANNELQTLRDEKLRLLAEMENLRKRFEKEKTETIKFGNINFARDILSPGDNLERALASFPEDKNNSQSIKNLVEGLKMVQKEFSSILEKNSIKKIISINEKFDHNFHQAMMEIEREDIEEGIVVQEIQAGYTMHDRLLRPSMVAVSKKPDNLKKKDDNDESGQKNSENDKKTQENK